VQFVAHSIGTSHYLPVFPTPFPPSMMIPHYT
jgi:hypothetical protein